MTSRKNQKAKPDHDCDGKGDTITIDMRSGCSCCPQGEQEMEFCCSGESNRWLAQQGAESMGPCPVCGYCCTLSFRIGRAWIGEPRFVWWCRNGCAPKEIRAAMLERGVHPGCLGDYAAEPEPDEPVSAIPAAFAKRKAITP